jgi:hypothetical protein
MKSTMLTKRQSTPARAAAARANGAKSRGPITARGKSNSSKNSFRHGLRSNDLLACAVNFNIPPTRVEEVFAALAAEYSPASEHEHVVRAAAELLVLRSAVNERFDAILKRHECRDPTQTCDLASIRADADFIDRFLPFEKRITQQLDGVRVRLDTLREQKTSTDDPQR